MEDKIIETSVAVFRRHTNGLIEIFVKPVSISKKEEMVENLSALNKLMGLGKSPFLIEFAEESLVTTEQVHDIFAEGARTRLKSAEALLVHTDAHYEAAHRYRHYYQHSHPIEIFENRREAERWIGQYL